VAQKSFLKGEAEQTSQLSIDVFNGFELNSSSLSTLLLTPESNRTAVQNTVLKQILSNLTDQVMKLFDDIFLICNLNFL
jgi:hypothetical protein